MIGAIFLLCLITCGSAAVVAANPWRNLRSRAMVSPEDDESDEEGDGKGVSSSLRKSGSKKSPIKAKHGWREQGAAGMQQ